MSVEETSYGAEYVEFDDITGAGVRLLATKYKPYPGAEELADGLWFGRTAGTPQCPCPGVLLSKRHAESLLHLLTHWLNSGSLAPKEASDGS